MYFNADLKYTFPSNLFFPNFWHYFMENNFKVPYPKS